MVITCKLCIKNNGCYHENLRAHYGAIVNEETGVTRLTDPLACRHIIFKERSCEGCEYYLLRGDLDFVTEDDGLWCHYEGVDGPPINKRHSCHNYYPNEETRNG